MTSTYHHGDLPAALRSATAELVAERGPTGFSLREVARRAGVSHAAPAHHFGDSQGLITAVAAEGFSQLADAFVEVVEGLTDPVERLTEMGKAYVRHAIDNPGHFGVMCATDVVNSDDPAFAEASLSAYQALLDALGHLRDEINPDLDVDAAATMTWSAVHGLAVLSPYLADVADKSNTSTGPLDELVEQFTGLMLSGYRARP